MPHGRLQRRLAEAIATLDAAKTSKRHEAVISGIVPAAGGRGPRYLLEGHGQTPFLRMNSNGYLGMATRPEVLAAAERAARCFGAGPGAVRFISGTWSPHIQLESRLAAFHRREAAMIFSSAYATVMGVLPSLITGTTAVISDALNHNCIINAVRLAGPRHKFVYGHLDLAELESALQQAREHCDRALIVTDGVFSMRGDHAPLAEIAALAKRHDAGFADNVLVIVDDSHGVGAFGATGRGTEEFTVIDYLRETAPFYIYSNPISAGDAAAATQAIDTLDSAVGQELLAHLRAMTNRFAAGLEALGLETIAGGHPVVPLLVRDTARTQALVARLRDHAILATGLSYPVVPRGEEEIRFQVCADHTASDIDEALDVIARLHRQI
jgi:glycine C-acetyltransferase